MPGAALANPPAPCSFTDILLCCLLLRVLGKKFPEEAEVKMALKTDQIAPLREAQGQDSSLAFSFWPLRISATPPEL